MVKRILWLTETDEGRTVIEACARPQDVVVTRRLVIGSLRRLVRRTDDLALIVVCGWRRLLPKDILDAVPAVGFHSAKLPEYPGRAPVPWTLVRGDEYAYTTLFHLDEGVDTGNIISIAGAKVEPGDTVASIYRKLAEADILLLEQWLDAILDHLAPRIPQDPAKRGPLTTKDGWDRMRALGYE